MVLCSVVVLETMVLVSSGLEAKSAGLGLGLELSGLGLGFGLDTYGVGLLTTGLGLGLAFKQDQDLINFYCAISATKL